MDGEAELDEAMVTGESRPVTKTVGDRVVAGTVSADSTLRVRVEAVGEDTALGGIQRLVAEAQASGSRAQALADRAAALLFYVALVAGAITLAIWAALDDGDYAVVRTVSVLVVACPHALRLAIPLTISLSTAVAAKAGILVKDRLALERMRTIDTVLFDKTGTLTKGEHVVSGVAVADDPSVPDEAALFAPAGAVEADSEHPLARANVTAARQHGQVPTATGFRALTGRGVQADVDGAAVSVGGPSLLRELGIEPPTELVEKTATWSAQGAAVLHVIRDGHIVGAISLEDEVRAESAETVSELHDLGVRVVLITGDAKPVADAVAARLGVDEVFAEVLPQDKDSVVQRLQGQGRIRRQPAARPGLCRLRPRRPPGRYAVLDRLGVDRAAPAAPVRP